MAAYGSFATGNSVNLGQVSALGFLRAIRVRTCDERGVGATQAIQVGYYRGYGSFATGNRVNLGQVSGLGFLRAIKVRTCDERGVGATQAIQVGYDRGLFLEVNPALSA
ncbi:hypothetical protein VNO77_03456 [Canavalia gladiata]|uniref:Uncharacterized protein n=1 Tax=Canavalia gladiata TaxID=3824 RepID=A0AAN9R863_CANGL